MSDGDTTIPLGRDPSSDSVAWLRDILRSLLMGGAEGVAGADTVVDVLQVSPGGSS